MSTQRPEQSGETIRPPTSGVSPLGHERLALVESSFRSLKAELAAGDAIDPEIIADLERRIEKLKA